MGTRWTRCCCWYMYYLLGTAIMIASGLNPVIYNGKETTDCGGSDQDHELMEVLKTAIQQLGPPGCNPPRNASCQEILYCFPLTPSGYYQIHAPNGSLVQVYCDMEGTHCGEKGGWTRVSNVNMSQSSASCPQGLTKKTTILDAVHVGCGRKNTTIGCQSTSFSVFGLVYSRVCGQVVGYIYGGPDAFNASVTDSGITIDHAYVDGASITYGMNPRKHIWTYAIGTVPGRTDTFDCPCNQGSSIMTPPYVGNDYYCESGIDTLWDGKQCTDLEGPCCNHLDMPWFTRTLVGPTNEDIELRVCGDDFTSDEDTVITRIELYVR